MKEKILRILLLIFLLFNFGMFSFCDPNGNDSGSDSGTGSATSDVHREGEYTSAGSMGLRKLYSRTPAEGEEADSTLYTPQDQCDKKGPCGKCHWDEVLKVSDQQ